MKNIFTKKNFNLFVQLFMLLIILWIVMFIIPNLFVFLFDSYFGNFILLGLIIFIGVYNLKYAFGLALITIILYRFNYLSRYQISQFIL
jgi:hypothetical protein